MLSLLLLAGVAAAAPQYGPPPPLPVPVTIPEKLVAPVIKAPAVTCSVTYVTIWDTEYQEREEQVCETKYEEVCNTEFQRLCQPTTRQECRTEFEQQCATVYKNVCVQQYKTEYEPYTESECTTEYKQDCQYQWEGQGNDKVWAPIQGTCQNVPYDQCQDVTKTHAKQVAYEACHKEPEQNCVSVPKEVCVTVPDQVCKNEPLRKCQELPREICHAEHRRYPIRVSRSVPKKTCGGIVVVQHAFPEAPQVILPAPVPAVQPSGVVGPDERSALGPGVEFGGEVSEVVDIREEDKREKLQVEQDNSGIIFQEQKV